MKTITLILQSLLFSATLQAQEFGWAIKQSGSDVEAVNQIAEDGFGNIYETGNFWATVDFDPSVNNYNLSSAGLTDIFIGKLDASGNFLWTKRTGSTGSDIGNSIAVDAAGNCYSGGKFQSTVDFDPSAVVFNLTSAGGDDACIVSYSTNGDFIWAVKFGGSGSDYIESLVEKDGYIYATGYFQGTVDFDPGAGVFNLTVQSDGAFIVKLDAAGNFVWAKSISGTSSVINFDIAVADNGSVYCGGEFWGTCDFDPGTGTQNKSAFGFASDAFVLKLDPNGIFSWVAVFQGNSDEWVQALGVTPAGKIVACGAFQNTTDFNPNSGTYNLTTNGNYDMFTVQLTSGGNFDWATGTGGPQNEQVYDVAFSGAGDCLMTGFFSNTVDFDPGPGIFSFTAAGVSDIFLQQLNTNGVFDTAFAFGAFLSGSVGNTVITDNSGRITFGGGFEQTVDFDPGPDVFSLTSILGTSDCFITQFNSCLPVQTTINTIICAGDSVFAAGNYQTASGTYTDYYASVNGCDSIVTLHLTVNPLINTSLTSVICEGDSFLFDGNILSMAGIYTAHFTALNGCDSLVTLTLDVNPNTETLLADTICDGSSYFFNGTEIFDAGSYTADLFTSTGCDSTVSLNLYVQPLNAAEIFDTICSGESVFFNGNEIDAAGSYTAVFSSALGCDSSVTLHLDVTEINTSVTQSGDTLTASGPGAIQWIFCESGLPVISATDFVFIPEVSGAYAAIVTNGDCVDTSACTSIYTGVSDLWKDPGLVIFPNPANDQVTLEMSNMTGHLLAELRNALGQIILQKKGSSSSVIFELGSVPDGVYMMYVFTGNKMMKSMLVIEH